VRRSERGFLVVDLDSTNGILVNGVRAGEWALSDGDVITVGATQIRYEES
jgi:pSer/pThr/pTyr-binding forkhead associated (FHA) protein